MTDKQRVFIRGVGGRGSEVIKMLEDLGGKKPPFDIGEDPSYIYFISHEGDIGCMLFESEVGKIIMDFYRELHLPEKWKDGDILVHTDDDGFIVYSVYKETKGFNEYTRLNSIRTYVSVDIYMYGINMVWDWDKDKCKLASDEESKQFHELLHKYGMDWDAENKQLVDWKWKPKDDERYYYILSDVTVHSCAWLDDNTDNSHFSMGNCFKTKEEAETMAEKIKKLLKGE